MVKIDTKLEFSYYKGIDEENITTVIAKTKIGYHYPIKFFSKSGLSEGKKEISKIDIILDEYQGMSEKDIEDKVYELNKKFNTF